MTEAKVVNLALQGGGAHGAFTWGVLDRLLEEKRLRIDGISGTVNFDHIKRHYYFTHDDINPTRIVPVGPAQSLWSAHHRERLILRP